jgi:MinD-like ATPase involved in chromosome partitioning or flagellar assembly
MIRVITIAADVEQEAALAFELERDPRFEVVFRCFDRVETLAAVRAAPADVLLSVGASPWFDYQCFEETGRAGLLRFGVADDIVQAELLEVSGFTIASRLDDIERLALERQGQVRTVEESEGPGRLLAVWGPKGAPGRTSIAIELAYALAESELSTALIDADLYGGDVAQLLAIGPGPPDIVTLARAGARGELRDPNRLESLLRVDATGPHLVPGLLRAQLSGEVSAFGWNEVLRAARHVFGSTVVDVGFCLEPPVDEHVGGRNEVALATVKAADKIVCVLRTDPVGVRTFLWAVCSHAAEIDVERTIFVANRVRSGEEREVKRLLRRHLGVVQLVAIPDRPDLMTEAMWAGRPVVRHHPDSRTAEAVRRVAELAGAEIPAHGFLARLAGKGRRA